MGNIIINKNNGLKNVMRLGALVLALLFTSIVSGRADTPLWAGGPLSPGDKPRLDYSAMDCNTPSLSGPHPHVEVTLNTTGARVAKIRRVEGRSHEPWQSLERGGTGVWVTSYTHPLNVKNKTRIEYALGNNNGWVFGNLGVYDPAGSCGNKQGSAVVRG